MEKPPRPFSFDSSPSLVLHAVGSAHVVESFLVGISIHATLLENKACCAEWDLSLCAGEGQRNAEESIVKSRW